jgi:hypothetical protein
MALISTPLKITSANAVYLLAVPGVFGAAQQIQGFSVDEAFDTEPAVTAEVQLGVDGFTAFGWTPRMTRQTLTLLAASPSFILFETWIMAQDAAQDVFLAAGTILIPAISRQYSLPNGALTRFPALPNARRVLMGRQFEITWGWPITSAPL